MTFDPKRFLIKVKGGKEYLPVAARLVWFRNEHPDWGIVTAPVEINLEKQYAIFSCTIFNADGKMMATATKMEDFRGFPDFLEKAETGSVGRALAYCGYGTQFAPELEEDERLVDAPYGSGGGGNNGQRYGAGVADGGNRGYNGRPAYNGNGDGGGNYSGGNYGNGGGYGGGYGGGGYNRQGPPPQQPQQAPAPQQRPAPPPPQVFESEPPPARTAGGITRVPEPQRDYVDPGGSEEDDESFDEEEVFAAAPLPVSEPAEPVTPPTPKPNPLAGNRCSVDGCSHVLSPSQMTMSMNKYGRPVCLIHQKDVPKEMAPAAASAPVAPPTEASPKETAAAGSGTGRRSTKPAPADSGL